MSRINFHVASIHLQYYLYLIYTTPINLQGPLPVPHDLQEYPRMLFLPSGQIHRPCAYRKLCSLQNAFPSLFLGRLYRPGPTCSIKTIQVVLL